MKSSNLHPNLLAILLAGALTSCSDPAAAGCSGDVDVSVVRYDPPVFSWAPECGVSNLAVGDPAERSLWHIHGGVGENTIEPPVTFGIVPKGAGESVPPGELQHGNLYIVRVFRLHQEPSGEYTLIQTGEQNFPW